LPAEHVFGLGSRKLVGRDHDPPVLEKGRRRPLPPGLVVGAAFEDRRRQRELVEKLLAPLLAQRGRHDQQDTLLALGPAVGDGKARLDRLAEADLVRKQGTLREGGRQREECYVHLMRVQVDARRRQRLRQRVLAQPFEGDAMREIGTLMRGVMHRRVVGRISLSARYSLPSEFERWRDLLDSGRDRSLERIGNRLPCPQSKRDPENSHNGAVACFIKKAAGAVSLSE
jgi:hypothetical protein